MMVACGPAVDEAAPERPSDAAGQGPACPTPATGPAIDHVVFAVADIDAATDSFRTLGFTVKPGRLHTDGLLNAHVKFPTAQEVELMTLADAPSGPIAESYARILDEGPGGAFLALAAEDLDAVVAAAGAMGLPVARPGGGRFVSFPDHRALQAVFFGSRSSVIDPDSILTHANGARAVVEVWVEGGPQLGRLLSSLGATECGPVESPEAGRRFGLSNGIVVIAPLPAGRRPRPVGVGVDAGAGRPLRWLGSVPHEEAGGS